jgi:hypothetical protein
MTAENLYQDATTASLPGSIDLPTKFSVRTQRQKIVLKKWCGTYEGLAADTFQERRHYFGEHWLTELWNTKQHNIISN